VMAVAVVGERRECKVNCAMSKLVGACLSFVYLTLEPFLASPSITVCTLIRVSFTALCHWIALESFSGVTGVIWANKTSSLIHFTVTYIVS